VPEFWSIGYESKAIIEKYHSPEVKNWQSGELTASDLTFESKAYILNEFKRQTAPGTFWRTINHLRGWLRSNLFYQTIKGRGRTNSSGSAIISKLPQQGLDSVRKIVRIYNMFFPTHGNIQLLEKTPENCLRLPFLEAIFPDMRVIYLIRDGRANVNSLIEGWRQPHLFSGYQIPGGVQIPGDTRGRWAFTLIPGWHKLRDRPLAEVCAWQWICCNQAVLTHRQQSFGKIPYLTIRYEDLISKPGEILPLLAEFLDQPYNGPFRNFAESLPEINITSQPDPEKWRKQSEHEIMSILPLISEMMQRLGYDVSVK
jgi:hypothetical protein